MNKEYSPLQRDLLIHIGNNLKDLIYQDKIGLANAIEQARWQNPWFDSREIERMLHLIFENYLDEVKLNTWLEKYDSYKFKPGKVAGIVGAGNIPLAVFQDVWYTLATGMSVRLKLSSKDQVLPKFFFDKINALIPQEDNKIQFAETLSGIDVLIASGSTLTANHFSKYSERVPCLIRAHRNGIAILSGDENDDALKQLGNDVFSFYGLGCRNISKIYIPDESIIMKAAKVFDQQFDYIRENAKYNNNYEYQLAVLSLNKNKFYQASSIYFNKSKSINSSIAVLNYEMYDSLPILEQEINEQLNSIQCISTNIKGLPLPAIELGKAQWPELWDYQDGIDVIEFLHKAMQ